MTLIFDLDGTLLNTIDDLADAGNAVCAAHGWPTFPVRQYCIFVGNGIPKLVERFSPPEARTPEQLAQTLQEFKTRYAAHMKDKTAPYPGLTDLLPRLHAAGVQMAVFSNKADPLAREVVADYFDPAWFAVVRGARDGVAIKPDAAGTLALLAELHADPATTLYVGDTNVDVRTAHNAGLPCCGALWGFRTREELAAEHAEYFAANAAELEQIIMQGGPAC